MIDRMTADPPSQQVNESEPAARVYRARDRRRPGRMEQVSPALIELLRSKPDTELPGQDHPLGAITGILLSAVVGLAMWAGLFWLIRILLR